ncbi:caspase Dronc-like 1 [Homarus americanus]|uniref:Caspase Dronc-like 1 n=1 Tax=Homarus americanus TaxID=6706 RepID=A0A8J5JSE0_HOMAM|nr:caspase Dronc-like 1 [Homarus americanus]
MPPCTTTERQVKSNMPLCTTTERQVKSNMPLCTTTERQINTNRRRVSALDCCVGGQTVRLNWDYLTVRRSTRSPRSRHQVLATSQKIEWVFKAVVEGNLILVEDLVKLTGPAITRVQTGCTLLHAAAANNQPHVVLFLLKLVSPNIVNKEGQTPAHLAAMKGHTQVLRILLSDEELNHHKLDNWKRTYKDLAVFNWNKNKIEELVKLGADPDYHVGRLVDRMLTRELQVTTARQLAHALQREAIVRMFPQQHTPENMTEATTEFDSAVSINSDASPDHELPLGPLRLVVTPAHFLATGPDVYKMDTDPRGYVCVLNYSSFKDRPDLVLDGSHSDVNNLANAFGKMGYTGHAYSTLTADQTKQVLTRVRDLDVLDQVGCGIFIISSHGIGNEKFLTSDMKLLTTEWICDLFKDSECPRLKNKPKLFIFDLSCGYYRDETRQQENTVKRRRVEEPLQDTMCLYSSDGGFTSYTFTKEGTPFITALCRCLAHHAHHMEFGDLYREFLKEYSKTILPSTPQLHNFGFNKKFYFNPGRTLNQ